jgi:phosphatidylserine/phosphatidylglycerophosphate/cardiolipin synthase-like enzyme
MHHKVMIIDEQTVVTGSYNFSANAEERNDENLLIIDNPELARQFEVEFDEIFSDAN